LVQQTLVSEPPAGEHCDDQIPLMEIYG